MSNRKKIRRKSRYDILLNKPGRLINVQSGSTHKITLAPKFFPETLVQVTPSLRLFPATQGITGIGRGHYDQVMAKRRQDKSNFWEWLRSHLE